MAYKKSNKKGKVGKSRPRGKVSGLLPRKYAGDTYLAVGVVAGMLAARIIPDALNKAVPGLDPKIVNIVQSGAGIFLAVTTGSMPFVRGASLGIAAMGLMDLATNAGILPGAKVGANEIMLDMSGADYGPYRSLAGGGLGASYEGQHYASNVLAGMGMGVY